jgi:penicillin-binding protein 2A
MAEAYSSFANLGVRNKAYAIRKITTSDGETIIEAKPEAVKVTDPSTAYTMTLLLKNVVDKGTGKNAALGRPVAGKTGSVELPPSQEFAGISKGVKDVWFVGYTPELTAAVWMGYDQTDREHYLTTSGGSEPAVVFREVLSRALSARPVVQFRMPTGYNINKMFPPKPDKKEKQKSEKRSEFLKEFIIDWDIFTKKDFKKKGKGRKNK